MKKILTLIFFCVFAFAKAQNNDNDSKEPLVVVEKMPEFPGGFTEMTKYLQKKVKYPKIARRNRIQGKVILRFIIEADGSVSNVSVLQSVSPELDDEAVRVIKGMPKWQPGWQGGKFVRVYFNIPISFKLRKQ